MTAGSVAVPTIIPLKAPSGPKHVIDTSTPVELRSDTAAALVFYTLDGSRPVPFYKHGRRSQIHAYRAPFTLTAGKVTIKAVATSQDGSKQSSVVTRTFTILPAEEAVESDDHIDMQTGPVAAACSPRPTSSQSRLSLASRQSMKNDTSAPRGASPSPTRSSPSHLPKPTSKLPSKEKHKPVCVYCNAPRCEEPGHHFCTHCGARLPPLLSTKQQHSRPDEIMAVCPGCRAEMPPELSHCLLCETLVIKPSSLPVVAAQADTIDGFTDKLVCFACGTANQPNAQRCVTCEKKLEFSSSAPPHTPPPLPTPTTMRPVSGSSYVMCGQCGRVNVSDARFCDWCGAQPAVSQCSVLCAGCSSANQWHHRHCFNCGALIKAPHRPGVEEKGGRGSALKMPAGSKFDENAWIPVVEMEEDSGPEVHSRGTQTHGLFYPSSRSLDRKESADISQRMVQTLSRDRIPRVHTFSPGKGLWRMQVEHVCSHLKVFAQGSHDLQTAIGSAEMGKLAAANAKQSDTTLNLHLTFTLKQSADVVGSRPSSLCSVEGLGAADGPITAEGGQTLERAGIGEGKLDAPQLESGKKKKKKPESASKKPGDLSGKLAAELSGQGRVSIVKRLVQQGADVNGVGVCGRPMLSLAATGGHTHCLRALVEAGAALNTQAKGSGNTALHEAVLQGPSTMDCIEALLELGADARLKNKEGLGPCELATKLHHEPITKCFAAHLGSSLLGQLCKQYSSSAAL